jgi:hypothetical protein
MKNLILDLSSFWLLVLLIFIPHRIQGQCANQVFHASGTQLVGCTNVTVTSQGSTSILDYCDENPYWIGVGTSSGSYTFTFSPPISGVSLGLTAINNQPAIPSEEEVRFEINGAPYPITVPGTPGSCFTSAVITSSGAVSAVPGEVGAWGNMYINTAISTLKVEDVIFSGTPNGVIFSLFFCSACCETNAGFISSSPLNLCPGSNATVPPAVQTFLESNDILRYILFSNLNDTLGSIVATSSTPLFSFNPATMQTDVTYYIAAMAGNNLNGNVDLNDPCLDFSNAVQVTWRPRPTVQFSLAGGDPNLCSGECRTITAALTGTPPFSLTYVSPFGSNTTTFSNNTGTFSICAPLGAPAGPLQVQATVLTDAWCTCE